MGRTTIKKITKSSSVSSASPKKKEPEDKKKQKKLIATEKVKHNGTIRDLQEIYKTGAIQGDAKEIIDRMIENKCLDFADDIIDNSRDRTTIKPLQTDLGMIRHAVKTIKHYNPHVTVIIEEVNNIEEKMEKEK